jgi:hypothetical protein
MIYGLVIDAQEHEIKHYCYPCGKICIGGLELDGWPLFPCKEDPCPHEEARSEPVGTAFDDTVCLRKLKAIPATDANGGE